MKVVVVAPDPQVDAGALHRGGDLRERRWPQGNGRRETEGMSGEVGRHVGEGNGGGDALFAAQAGPEGGVDQGLDRDRGRSLRESFVAALAGRIEVPREVGLDLGGHEPGGGVGGFGHSGGG